MRDPPQRPIPGGFPVLCGKTVQVNDVEEEEVKRKKEKKKKNSQLRCRCYLKWKDEEVKK